MDHKSPSPAVMGKKSHARLLGSCWDNPGMEVKLSIRLGWRGSLASRDWVVVCLFRSRERPSFIGIPNHGSVCR